MTGSWDEEFHPSAGTRNVLRWAQDQGATTLGEAFELLEQLELSNDVPEVLGHDDTVDGVRDELEAAVELLGADAPLTGVG